MFPHLAAALLLAPALLAGCSGKAGDTGSNPLVEIDGTWKAVAAGGTFTCAVRDDDGVPVCWGDGAAVSTVPPDLDSQIELTAGDGHACSRGYDGTPYCWGDDEFGQATAVEAAALLVSAGARHTCSLTASGLVNCWGDDSEGAIYPPSDRFSTLASGENFACGVSDSTGLSCWGDEDPNTGEPRPGGPAIAPGLAFDVLAGGWGVACGIVDDTGAVTCWGDTEAIGDRFSSGEWQALSLGSGEQCGLSASGDVSCVQLSALGVSLDGNFQAVAGGGGHGCALSTSGRLTCWAVGGDDMHGAAAGPL